MVEQYIDYSMMALSPMLMFIGLAFAIAIIYACFPKRKSKEYRELMCDMFVVGKVKQLADEEKIDLKVELKEFAKFMKIKKIDQEELDNTIERELKEKIAKVAEEKENPPSKK